jgi:hypothetical protein
MSAPIWYLSLEMYQHQDQLLDSFCIIHSSYATSSGINKRQLERKGGGMVDV